MRRDLWRHRLSVVVRWNDHFTGRAVTEELDVRLDGSFVRPVTGPGGGSRRQPDGTYRFVDLPGGVHRVRWMPPHHETWRHWVSWEPELEVDLPLAEPDRMIQRDLWLTPGAALAPSTTAVRGRLMGSSVGGLEVRIAAPGETAPHFTRSDRIGEFLYPLTAPPTPDEEGYLELELEVAGGARPVTGGSFLPAGTAADFASAVFAIPVGRSHRILFHVA